MSNPLIKVNILKFCVLVFLAFCSFKIFSDELHQREKELSEIQSLIEEQRRSANEAEQRRQSAIQRRQQTQTQLNSTQKKVMELNTTQQNLQRSIDHSNSLFQQTESSISQLQISINKAMLHLLYADQAELKLRQHDHESHLISLHLQKLFTEDNKLQEEMSIISTEKQNRENEFYAAQNLSKEEQSRLNTISTNLQRINTDIDSFERQREDYRNLAEELERTAIALQNLINELKIESHREYFTFQFPNGTESPLNGRVITHFGPRRNARYNITTISNGVNIAAPENSPVRAFSDGEVVFADLFTGSGMMIIIDHKNGFHTIYGYNNDLLVQKGDLVTKGQFIARSGTSGTAAEPSLHFELRKSGQPVNPLDYIIITP